MNERAIARIVITIFCLNPRTQYGMTVHYGLSATPELGFLHNEEAPWFVGAIIKKLAAVEQCLNANPARHLNSI